MYDSVSRDDVALSAARAACSAHAGEAAAVLDSLGSRRPLEEEAKEIFHKIFRCMRLES